MHHSQIKYFTQIMYVDQDMHYCHMDWFKLRYMMAHIIYIFIALIHPIQWTIAYPVGADRPAKRQKKTSCVSTGQAGPVLCTRQVACRTSFLSRQSDVIASFSFGACTCCTDFLSEFSSLYFVRTICYFHLFLSILDSRTLIDYYVFSQSTAGRLWPHDGRF